MVKSICIDSNALSKLLKKHNYELQRKLSNFLIIIPYEVYLEYYSNCKSKKELLKFVKNNKNNYKICKTVATELFEKNKLEFMSQSEIKRLLRLLNDQYVRELNESIAIKKKKALDLDKGLKRMLQLERKFSGKNPSISTLRKALNEYDSIILNDKDLGQVVENCNKPKEELKEENSIEYVMKNYQGPTFKYTPMLNLLPNSVLPEKSSIAGHAVMFNEVCLTVAQIDPPSRIDSVFTSKSSESKWGDWWDAVIFSISAKTDYFCTDDIGSREKALFLQNKNLSNSKLISFQELQFL